MKISDILNQESKNFDSIILHNEGLFWRAYEHSAYCFVSNVKQYQLTKKHYKNVKTDIVYLGFPHNSLETILSKIQNKTVEKEHKQIIIKSFEFDLHTFTNWKASIELFTKENNSDNEQLNRDMNNYNDLIYKIRDFPVVSKTPFECQQFIIEIQKQTNGSL